MDENFGKDCNNVCNGTARNDTCGQCSNPPADDPNNVESPFRDCNGDCFKGAMIDSCGNCTGGLTGRLPDFWRDACGKCKNVFMCRGFLGGNLRPKNAYGPI